jgi:hypothetical protein
MDQEDFDVELADLERKFLARASVHKDLADKGSEYSRGAAFAYVDAADVVGLLREVLS